MKTITEIIQQQKQDYITTRVKKSKYVNFSLYDTISRIDAYVNSTHTSSATDSLGRDKPFYNIVNALRNVWYRATDIDRSDIKVRPQQTKDRMKALLATVFLQKWMEENNFGDFLNKWGRTLATYGSAVVKVVEDGDTVKLLVVPWDKIYCDSADFYKSVQFEPLELTQAELMQRVTTHGYNQKEVERIINDLDARKNQDGTRKDNKNDFIRVYELHGYLSKEYITGKEADRYEFVHQMHVIAELEKTRNKKGETYELFKGIEEESPYVLTHLIEEDGRTLGIGAVESAFEAQWMQNHTAKATKDALDLANLILFQTSDTQFLNKNTIMDMSQGDVLITAANAPLTAVQNSARSLAETENFRQSWKQQANEAAGVSEAMLGAMPKSGTAWRQTEAVLTEGYSLFSQMTENKGIALSHILKTRVIPVITKRYLNHNDEILAELDAMAIKEIDRKYLENKDAEIHNSKVKDILLNQGKAITEPIDNTPELLRIKQEFADLGNQRPLKTSEIYWKHELKGLEWDVIVDVTNEKKNIQESMQTINTAIQSTMQPGYAQNPAAQELVAKALDLTGTLSPLEVSQFNGIMQQQVQPNTMGMGGLDLQVK